MKTGYLAWQAFTSADPTEIEKLFTLNISALPFLRAALLRHLQQFPSTLNGISRTEQQILNAVHLKQQSPLEIFLYDQSQEECVFMGDWTLWSYVKRLCEGAEPLLKQENNAEFFLPLDTPTSEFWEQKLSLTNAGQAVQAGAADYIHLNGVDRWLGGVHLQGNEAAWRWDGIKLVAGK
jgi:hypothetical protein